jgi:type IV secretion system protein VirD4
MICRMLILLGFAAMAFAMGVMVYRYPSSIWAVAFILLAIAISNGRKVVSTVFGSSRWADARELAPLMAARDGILLGRALMRPSLLQRIHAILTMPLRDSDAACRLFFGSSKSSKAPGELVRLPDAIHTSLFIPTGVGKSTGFMIPHLLTCENSAVATDFKAEMARATARHREKQFGHRCVFLDPFREFTTKPDGLNPMDLIGRDDPDLIDACRELAESVVIRTGNERDPTWCDSAENVIRTICCYVAHYAPDDDRSLQTVRDIIADARTVETSSEKGQFQLAVEAMQNSDAFDGLFARMGNQLTHYRDKELASVLTTCSRFLSFLDSPAIKLSTEYSTFSPAMLKRGKMTVYCILPAHALRAQSALLRMWLTTLTRAVVKEGLNHRKVHFVCDEAASLGNLPAIEDALDKYRSYGIRLILAYQSLGQLQKCWPDGQAQTLLSNTTQVFAGVQDNQTAEYVSARLGSGTIVVGSTTKTSGRNWGDTMTASTYSSGHSTSWSYQKRELLQPAEVTALPQNVAITFTPGLRPIHTKLVRFFEEPALFTGRRNSLLAYGLMLARSACFLFLSLCIALMMLDFSRALARRPPTPSVGQWGTYGKGQKLDPRIGNAPGRPR